MNSLPPLPRLHIDIQKTKEHISSMALKAKTNSVEFRPHFKTHQSHSVGNIFREYGVKGITVSSITMAEYFQSGGWKDITLAFPANILDIPHYNSVLKGADLKLLVQSEEVCDRLSAGLCKTTGVYIELDPDYGRSGVSYTDHDKIESLRSYINKTSNLNFIGFYCHAGNSYKLNSAGEVKSFGNGVLNNLEKIRHDHPDAEICYGDTPTCTVLDSFGPVSQLSPGNFVFYDVMQAKIGSCQLSDISVYLSCPVVEKKEISRQLIVHGGAVHLSKESLTDEKGTHYGLVKGYTDSRVISISQEHGIIQCEPDLFDSVEIGDKVEVLPVHSCLTADLMGFYTDLSGAYYDHLRSSARGKSKS